MELSLCKLSWSKAQCVRVQVTINLVWIIMPWLWICSVGWDLRGTIDVIKHQEWCNTWGSVCCRALLPENTNLHYYALLLPWNSSLWPWKLSTSNSYALLPYVYFFSCFKWPRPAFYNQNQVYLQQHNIFFFKINLSSLFTKSLPTAQDVPDNIFKALSWTLCTTPTTPPRIVLNCRIKTVYEQS